ncbi:MAG: carbamoyltransferase HypF [Phycisphaerae bacterium]|nr:carbamoyltransferase HypF [Phycisphaerae bacterium]
MKIRNKIVIQGQVQGVGCRPYIYRLAGQLGLTGSVFNDSRGVVIEVQGTGDQVCEFIKILENGKKNPDWPPLMIISSMRSRQVSQVSGERGFTIRKSPTPGEKTSHVTADSATCPECLAEMNDPNDFRYRYPFINCTNCGPRYTIVETIPYDRCNTTMADFTMCKKCSDQYTDPKDRRFHAQPVACPDCGPKIWLADPDGKRIETNSDKAIAKTAEMLKQGKILAIKGLGGFHLAVDAKNEAAVQTLRQRKQRDHKPFALMAASIEKINQYAEVTESASALMTSPQSPIVLLKKRKNTAIAPSVAQGLSTLGFMLCYTPLHHLLFAEDGVDVLVMTSANLSDEPLICDNDEAMEKLYGIADAFLMHNRDIRRQTDDSIVHIVAGAQALIRRSRGFTPGPVLRDKPMKKQIFAAGADMKNTFCLAKGNQFILSEHIGDLEDSRVYRHYVESIKHLRTLFDINPEIFVSDLHPSYISTQYAQSLGGAETIQVQHHWAHVASVLAEYDYSEKVIGLVADGTGLGTDGAIWGCECLIASLAEFTRFGHMRYFPLPGGDAASKDAIRPVLGLLSTLSQKHTDIIEAIEPDGDKVEIIESQNQKNINTVKTSSMGRLFDAVAAILGLGKRNQFEAQLPMTLESAILPGIKDAYNVRITEKDRTFQLDYRTMLKELLEDKASGVTTGIISAKFHNWVAAAMVGFAIKARKLHAIKTVALSGGVFCNNYLANLTIQQLKNSGFFVLFKRRVPANDGGIALGQAAIAAEMCK